MTILIFSINIISCGEEKQQYLYNQIIKEVNKNINSSLYRDINVIIITDKDCLPCFEKYRKFNNDIVSIGFYFSNYPSDFYNKLLKLNKEIIWKPLDDKRILELLSDWDEDGHGPYTFLLKENKLIISNKFLFYFLI